MQYDINWEKDTVEFKFETQTQLRNFMRYAHEMFKDWFYEDIYDKWPQALYKTNQNTHSFVGGETEYIKPGQKLSFSDSYIKYDWISKGPRVRRIIANDGAVVVIFTDNRKVIVKRMPGDDDDIYAAVAQAVCKRLYGSTGHFHKVVDKKLEDFRSPVSIAQPVFDSFGRFFDSLWDITHPKEDKQNNKEEE